MKTRLLIVIGLLLTGLAYSQVPTTNLHGEYTFDGGVLTDGVGSNDFTQTGTALTVVTNQKGMSLDAISLNGDHLQRAYIYSGDLSVSFWVKTTTNNGNKTTIIDQSKRTGDAENSITGWYIYLQNGRVGVSGNFGAYAGYTSGGGWSGQSGYLSTLGTTDLSDDEWHHVTVTMQRNIYHPSNYTFYRFRYYYHVYVDGVLENSATGETTSPYSASYNYAGTANLLSTTTSVTVANNYNTDLSYRYADAMDDLRFYTTTLSATDVENLYEDGLCKPIVATQDITVQLDASGNASITTGDIDNGTANDCGIVGAITLSLDKTTFTCSDLGSTVVTLTAEDINGGIGTGTATVTIEDSSVPSAIAQDITVQLDVNTGIATITAADVDNGSTDNCSGISLSLSQSQFDCADIGANAVVLTVEDVSGNQSTANATVTVTSPINDETVTATNQGLCAAGNSTTITTGSSVAGIDYYLRNSSNDAVVDGPIAGTGNGLSFNTGPINTTTTYNVYGETGIPENYALDFDGINDYITASVAPSFDYGAGYTFEAMVKVSIPVSAHIPIMSLGNSSFSDIEIYVQNSTNDLVVSHERGGAISAVTYPNPPSNQWFHLAVTFDGTNIKLYIDGVEQTPLSTFGGTGAITKSNYDLKIGRVDNTAFGASGSVWKGQLDEVRFWSVARTQPEIDSNKSSCLMGNETGLEAYYKFDEGTGLTAIDLARGNDGTLNNMDGNTDWVVSGSGITCSAPCGIQMTTEVTVNVGDNVNPTPATQNITVQLDGTGNASISVADINNGSSDNCTASNNLVLSLDKTTFMCADLGANMVTLTVQDVTGNQGTATATVTVVDGVAPTALAKDITVQLDATGNAVITAADVNNASTDNCTAANSLLLSLDKTAFTCADLGANTVTLTVEDGSGNQSTTTSTVTVADVIVPVAITQDLTVQLDATGNANITPADINNGSTDNCTASNNLILSLDKTAFTCADLGANTVTLTVEDASSNQSTATATITVVDAIVPTAISQDIAVQLDATGNAVITAADVNNASTDNCTATNSLVLSLDKTAFTCADLGANTVSLTVTDGSSNQSIVTATVTVTDAIVPTAVAQDITVQLDATGNATITAAQVDNGSTDNCSSGASLLLSLSQSTFGCADLGANTVTLTIEDASGNQTTTAATVTVEDNLAPTAIAKDITVNLDGSGNASITAAQLNNGSTDNCTAAGNLVLSIDKSSFVLADLGANTVTLTVADANGNSSTATSTVTVEEKTSQTITFAGLANKTYGDASFTVSATATSSLAVSYTVVSGPATITGSDVSITGAGSVIIEANQAGDATFAAAPAVQQSFTVNPAALTATADDKAITYGEAIPTLTFSYSGFVNGEDVSALTAEPTATTTATAVSDAGTYPITLAGGTADNYAFSLTDGSLTINKADQTVTLAAIADQDITQVTTVEVTATASSGLATTLTVTGPATISGTTITLIGTVGTVTVTASQAGGTNYNTATDATTSFEAFDSTDPCFGFAVSLAATTNNNCNGAAEGSIDITVTGGDGNYSFAWDNNTTSEDAANLAAGTYTVTVTDGNGCTVTLTETISEPSLIEVTATTTDVVAGNDGAADITVTGGTGAYTFSWSNGDDTEDLANVAAGSYTVTVTDENGCSVSQAVEVGDIITNIKDVEATTLQIYPNPVSDYLTLEGDFAGNVEVQIINNSGQQMITKHFEKLTSNMIELELNTLKNGQYLVIINSNNTQTVKRINIKH